MTSVATTIYRYTSPGDNYTSPGFTDKIEMDLGVVPDSTGHMRQTSWEGQISLQENPQPTTNRPHDVQDLGVSWFTAELVGFIEAPPSSLIPATILAWFGQPKQNASFPFGRFGITTADFPAFNSHPTATYGYNLEYIKLTRPGEAPKVDLIMRFKFNGDIAGLGVAGP